MRAIFLVCVLSLTGCVSKAGTVSEPLLTHSVFFELNDDDPAAIQAMVDGCCEFSAPHDGIVYFSAVARHTDYHREVNDLDFDVALTTVF